MFNFGSSHGAKAHLYVPGQDAEVAYEGQKLLATIVKHDGHHGVVVKLKTPVLKVTITITKRLLREDLYKEEAELVEELDLYEGYVTPL